MAYRIGAICQSCKNKGLLLRALLRLEEGGTPEPVADSNSPKLDLAQFQ